MRIALQLVAVIVLVAIAAVFGLAIWSRRGERRPDLESVRTICRFAGGSRFVTDAERAAELRLGPSALGEGVLHAIRTKLEATGIEVDGVDADDYGWGMHVRLNGDVGYLLVGRTGDEPDIWQLLVLSPGSGGPGPTSLLDPVNRALRLLDGITNIAWHAREDVSCANPSAEPIERTKA